MTMKTKSILTSVFFGLLLFGGFFLQKTDAKIAEANDAFCVGECFLRQLMENGGRSSFFISETSAKANIFDSIFSNLNQPTAIFTVSNTNDAGAGSLRQAIIDANSTSGADTIDFTVSGTVNLLSALPYITDSVTFNGNNATVAGNNTNYGIFRINIGLIVTINNLTIRDGRSIFPGGCLSAGGSTLNLINSKVTNCSSTDVSLSQGGGINVTSGSLLIIGSVVSDNLAYKGGGLYLKSTNARIENSTISGNTSQAGGGIMNEVSSLQMSNVTISGNSASSGGGGFYNFDGTATLRNCTIANNTASVGGGILNFGTTIIANTILADNIVKNTDYGTEITNGGIINYLGRNVIAGLVYGTTPPADTITTDPHLGALQNNGGLVPTLSIPPASAAYNAGVNAEALDTQSLPIPLTTDARGAGFPRILSGTVDIGAYESSPNILPPTISDISDQTVDEDMPTAAIAFTVGDTDVPPEFLIVSAVSSNAALVPNNAANIIFGGAGANRTIQVIPALDQFGTTTMTVTVSDGDFTAQDTFVLTVNPINDIPTISDITDQVITENTNTGALTFVIDDGETPVADLTVSGSSANTTLVPNNNIVFGGSGANRTVTITPTANQSGTATITITVEDSDGETASDTFILEVSANLDVTNTNDSGVGSLRQAILDANNIAGPNSIDFIITGTINLTSALPNITDSVIITGNNSTVAGNDTDFRIFTITSGLTVTINNLTMRDGRGIEGGGCIYATGSTLNLINSTMTSCSTSSFYGGGIYAAGGSFLMTGSVVSDNSDTNEGGGLFLNVPNARIENSTISGNSSLYGGGIMNYSSVKMSNVTISGNSATSGGGGFYNYGTTATLRNCTIANNSDGNGGGGGILNYPGRTTTIANTILAGNTSSINYGAEISNDGTITYLGRNLIVGSVAGTTKPEDTITANPDLGALQNNGGLVPTRMFSVLSSAYNAGVNAEALDTQIIPLTLTTDARGAGFPRILFDTVDIGAFENGGNVAISDIPDQRIVKNSNTGAIMFTIGDGATPAADLTVSGSSSNPTLVPNGNIVFGGSGANRSVTVTPAANQTGTATITVTVTDEDGNSASDTFVLEVLSFDVTNTNDSGAGSLRQAIINANATVGADTIDFNISGTINLTRALPDITDSVTINGNNATVAGNDTNFRIFTITSGSVVTINNLTMRDGRVNDHGGCIFTSGSTLNLINSTVTSCSTSNFYGGGIYATGGNFLMTGSVVSDNSDTNEGGGLFLNVPNARIENSTVSGNSSAYGGGIMNYSSMQMSNVTISGNSSTSGGGGFYNYGTTATLRNCTIADNSDGNGGGGGILNYPGRTTTIANTILTGNTSTNGAEIYNSGTFNYLGRNLIVGSVFGTTKPAGTITANPNLGALQNNGGLVPTRAIPLTSSARNVGVNSEALDTQSLPIPLTTDARGAGFPRILSGTVDIGAYERTPNSSAPTISDIVDQTVDEDMPTAPIAFTIGDTEVPPESLIITAASSNTALVPNNAANIIFGGSEANRTIQVIPALNQFGTTTITVTVSDGDFTAQDTFVLTVNSINDIPTISDITDQTIVENSNTGVIMFTIGDAETSSADLIVSGSSSNTTLVPNGNIVFGGSGANRTITITPAVNQSGTATIIVTITDEDGNTASDTFILDVVPLDVTNTNDSGAGSLRQAMINANAAGGADTIDFTISGTINLTSALPDITDSVTINGNNATVAGNDTNFRIFTINSGLTVTINNLTMRDGRGIGSGGCILTTNSTLNLINSTVTSCSADSYYGSGIYATGGSFLMTGSVVSDNSGDNEGGGLFLQVSNARIENSTVSGNSTVYGGGIMNYGSLAMSNVTISGNSSTSGGGGLYNYGTTATLRNCTIADNTASDGGGILNYSGRTTTIANTILTGNTSTNGAEIYNSGTFNYLGVNVIVGSVFSANQPPTATTITTDPNLDALQINGGLLPTRAIPPTSSAYNAGIDSEALDTQPIPVSLTLDARGIGFVRTNGAVDIGAFERQLYFVTPTILPNGATGQAYNNPLTAADGNSPYSFTHTSGTLPTGLSLNTDGTWSGLASEAGIFNFTVQVNDASLFTKNNSFAPAQISQKNFQMQVLAPTAANVSISGRVIVDNGAGLRNAIVTLVKANGETVSARTATFGAYRFDNIEAGQTVIVSVRSKSYQFAPQVVSVSDDLADLNFYTLE